MDPNLLTVDLWMEEVSSMCEEVQVAFSGLLLTIRIHEIGYFKNIVVLQVPQRLRLRHQPFEQRAALLN